MRDGAFPRGLHQPKTLEEASYDSIREAITSGRLGPGDAISVNRVAQELGVSRLPVIHALRRLASEGFVRIRPHKSVLVTKPTSKELRVRYHMISALERVALLEGWPLSPKQLDAFRRAHEEFCRAAEAGDEGVAERDRDFHALLWQAPGVEQLQTAIHALWDQGAYYRHLVDKTSDRGVLRRRIEDHQAIYDAVARGDAPAAVDALHAHRAHALERLEKLLKSKESATAPAGATTKDEN